MLFPPFEPSIYQRVIFQTIEEGYRTGSLFHLVIIAAAGSGKSTTLKLLREYIPTDKKMLYLTFGHDVNEELAEKIKRHTKELKARRHPAPKASCYTIHVLGNSCLHAHGIHGDAERGKRKYHKLAQEVLKRLMGETYQHQLSEQIKDLIDKIRLTLTPPTDDNVRALLQRFTDIDLNPSDKEVWPIVLKAVPLILAKGIEQAQSKVAPLIDFTDQIWLPSSMALNLQPRQYDVILVDEAQDLSPCQRELVRKAAKPDGLKIYVGDPDQAIFAFAGASLHSIEEIIEAEAPRVKQLPLSICYRCPRSVVEFAAQIRPGIEPAETAEEGIVEHIPNESVAHRVKPGDLILCRTRAPLVEQCLGLLRMKKRATVLGMDLGKTFEGLLDRIYEFHQQREFRFTREHLYTKLPFYAQGYESHEMAVLKENEEENESRISRLEDNIATLEALYEGHREETPFHDRNEAFPHTYQGFLDFMNHFFKEDREAQIILSTGHKAKGMEFPRVFILSWNKQPHSRAQSEDALKQEQNWRYVVVTRAKKEVYLAYEPEKEDKQQPEDDYRDAQFVSYQENIASQEIISYLRGTGWKRLSAPEEDPIILGRSENPEMTISLPTYDHTPNGFALIATALQALGQFEQSGTVLERIHGYRDGETRCMCNTSLRSLHDLFGYDLFGHITACTDCGDPRGMHVGDHWRLCLECGSYTKREDETVLIGNTKTGEQRMILPEQQEETEQRQFSEEREAVQPIQAEEQIERKKAGRPKKGTAGRVRKNCSFDYHVAKFLDTKADFSNYVEGLVKADPDFAIFLQQSQDLASQEMEEPPRGKKSPYQN